jgi:hypothetical protein
MPSAIPPSNPPPTRTPAWQRLGLKLKSAQQLPVIESQKVVSSPIKKRKAGAEGTLPAKKVKSTKTPSAAELTTPALSRKKSVTFTPETKAEDGESIKQLFTSWVQEQNSQDPSFQLKTSSHVFDTPEPPKVQEHFDTTLDEKGRRVKRVKKPQAETTDRFKETRKRKQKAPKIVKPRNTTTRPFLAYLRQYHEDRAHWKFNKNHQNHILKNVFDLNAIPSDHVPLIYEYIRGLQGGVRTRLRDTALSIKVKDQEEGAAGFAEEMDSTSAEDREKRQREYEVCCNEYVAIMTAANAPKNIGYEEGVLLGLSDDAMKARVAKRTRAELILAELGAGATLVEAEERATPKNSGLTYPEEVTGDDDSQKRLRMNDGSTQKVARKRKQRTANVENTASSDDTSDSDDGDSSSEDSEPGEQADQEDETSSSSSSSSSGTESEDGEDDSSGSGSGSGSGSEDESEESGRES